ncbi:MAG: pyrroloquinoline quinone precursor peptide PqqA [Acidobacteriia bacterium]|nr:pyrroloquinoline quinone precursor peptide PqqA [Terriglobia bacterium]
MLFSVDPAPPQVILNGVNTMVWTAPVFEEVSLCCEINSYASAKL